MVRWVLAGVRCLHEEDGGIATEIVEGKGAGWESLDSSSNN